MNLVLDLGNTWQKVALFNGDELVSVHNFIAAKRKDVVRICSDFQIESSILCSVVNAELSLKEYLVNNSSYMAFTEKTPLPIINLYETPATLGKDRLACAVAAWKLFPNCPVLSIDCGTCIKYNFVTEKGEFPGGSISPGIKMRLKAMHRYTSKLPLPELTEPAGLIGKNTIDSILSGTLNGALIEIDGVIDRYMQEYAGLKVILTGGDSAFFENKLKNCTLTVPHLGLKGLNLILNYNAVVKKN